MKAQAATAGWTDIYRPRPATLLRVQALTKQEMFFEVKLNSGEPLGHWPGQFVQVSVPGFGEAPFSISSSPTRGDSFELVVRRVGVVSGALHRLRPVDQVGIRGPFGTHFPVEGAMKGHDLLFLAGGIGLVPLRSAIQYVLDRRSDYGRIMILIGSRTSADRLFVDEIESWRRSTTDITVLETVDHRDSHWPGIEGVITMLLPLVRLNPARTVALICGPPIMYKFVIVELKKSGVPETAIYVSLERRMKCGVGKCGHCQIEHLYACRDGPVFRVSDITDVEEAF